MLTENNKATSKAVAKVVAQIISQFQTSDADEWEGQLVADISEAKTELNGEKASPLDFVDSGLNLAKAVAIETGNETAIKIVTDIADTAEDAIHLKTGALIGDLIKDYKDIKAAVKAAKEKK